MRTYVFVYTCVLVQEDSLSDMFNYEIQNFPLHFRLNLRGLNLVELGKSKSEAFKLHIVFWISITLKDQMYGNGISIPLKSGSQKQHSGGKAHPFAHSICIAIMKLCGREGVKKERKREPM